MLIKELIKYCGVFTFFTLTIILGATKIVEASSYKYCNNKIEGTNLYDCGNKIYTYYEDKEHSTTIVSSNESSSILYAGTVDGMEIFYANGIQYHNVSYDDLSSQNNNLWTKLTSKGKVIFDGAFNDSFIDDSHSGYYRFPLYDEVYTIRQYHHNGELYRTIVIYIFKDWEIDFVKASYDDIELLANQTNEVLDSKRGMEVDLSSKYGIKSVDVTVNRNKIDAYLKSDGVFIDSFSLKKALIKSETSTIKITAYDYLGNKKSIEYDILLLSNEVVINFSTMSSIVESDSRRIVIDATAGKGKTLDIDYCWYYWSTSPDDSLVYEEFLKNYANSNYKGSYSEDKGVILRNTSGTYYLYALAKDDDSVGVVRSEGYILNGEAYKVSYNIYDAIFVVSLLIVAVIPISIYLLIKKKGY